MAKGHLARIKRRLAVTAAATAIACASPALAQDRAFSVPAMPATEAVATLARQANVQILLPGRTARGIRTNAVNGSMPIEDALRALLEGTGLSARRTGAQTWTIVSAEEGHVPGEGEAGGAAANSGSAGDSQTGIAEILVVGRRTLNTDIARSEDDPQPYVVFEARDIRNTPSTNLEDFFRTRLTANTVQSVAAENINTSNFGSNIGSVNLRGLGTNQTLILVDGRRAPRVSSGGITLTQADINGIPLASIERIEVLPSTAGGIYGGGAVGGVINIIRRRDYRGVEFGLQYDGVFRGGGDAMRADVNGGFALFGGGTQVSFSGSYAVSEPYLGAAAADFWEDQRRLFLDNGNAERGLSLFSGATPNIRTADGSNLRLDAAYGGATLSANHLFVPAGYRGALVDGVTPLLANLGRYDVSLSADALGTEAEVRSGPRIWSGNISLRQEVVDWLQAYVDFSYSDNLGRRTNAAFSNRYTLSANAPNNPFQQNIVVYFPVTGLARRSETHSQAMLLTGGAVARLGHGWSTTIEYSRNQSRTVSRGIATPLASTAGTALANGTLDAFRDVALYPLDYSPYLIDRENQAGPVRFVTTQATARLGGPLLRLPAGPVNLTAAAETRREAAGESMSRSALNSLTTPFSTSIQPPRSQSNLSGYAELRIPIFAAANARPFLRELELQASIRHDRYETRSPNPISYNAATPPATIGRVVNETRSTDYTLAARWVPVRGLMLRGSYATGFLPPALQQIVTQTFTLNGSTLRDPRRNNGPVGDASGNYTSSRLGNPDLQPEQSRSLSLGMVIEPAILPGLRLSLDYTRIRKVDEITSFNFTQQVLDLESLFPDRVTRGSPLPGDAPGLPGPVIGIDESFINAANSRVIAWDAQLDYSFEIAGAGRFRLYGVATYEQSYTRRLVPNTPEYEIAGFFTGPLEWRGNVGLNWERGNVSAGWNFQYYDGQSVRTNVAGNTALDDTLVLQNGTESIPDQGYHDIYLRYRFPDRAGVALSGLEVFAGVQNLFDTRPPLFASSSVGGGVAYGDLRLRRFSISLRKAFN